MYRIISVVTWPRAGRKRNHGLIAERNIVLFTWPGSGSHLWVPGVKRPGLDSQSSPSGAEFKSEWSHVSIPPYAFISCDRQLYF